MLTETLFYFLRHGETDWNRVHRVQGHVDIPLNATGRAQAQAARELIRGCGLRRIFTSPLSRARETAEILQESAGCEISIIDELKECGLGAGEGQVKGAWFEDWRRGIATPSGAEPYGAFIERALQGINCALAAPGPVLIVAHGGVYWAIEKHARMIRNWDIPNAVPIRHDPPLPGYPHWRAMELGDGSGT